LHTSFAKEVNHILLFAYNSIIPDMIF